MSVAFLHTPLRTTRTIVAILLFYCRATGDRLSRVKSRFFFFFSIVRLISINRNFIIRFSVWRAERIIIIPARQFPNTARLVFPPSSCTYTHRNKHLYTAEFASGALTCQPAFGNPSDVHRRRVTRRRRKWLKNAKTALRCKTSPTAVVCRRPTRNANRA